VLLLVFMTLLTTLLGDRLGQIAIGNRPLDLKVLLAQFCTIFFATIVSYAGHKFFTFRTPSQTGTEEESSPGISERQT
jgi:putative flippase GtrA